MEPFEIIGQICGVFVIVAGVVAMQFSKRWQILLALGVLNLLTVFNMLFLGMSFSSVIGCALAAVQCPISAYKAKKGLPVGKLENAVWSVLYFAAWGVGLYLSAQMGMASWRDALPFLGTVTFVLSVLLPKERDVRIFSFLNALVYFIYNLLYLNVAAVSQMLTMISIVIALIRYREKKVENKNAEI